LAGGIGVVFRDGISVFSSGAVQLLERCFINMSLSVLPVYVSLSLSLGGRDAV
jgi:hypothetical protein